MGISTAIDQSAIARVVGIKTDYVNLRSNDLLFLPQRIAVVGQGSTSVTYSTTKRQFTRAFDVGSTYGFGSPLHLAALQILPVNGDGVGTIPVTFYPLDDAGAGVASAGDITPSGTQTIAASYRVAVNNILSEEFVIAPAASVEDRTAAITEAINSVLAMPIVAVDNSTVVDFTSKWKGVSANDIKVSIVGSTTAGTSFAITQPTGGLVNPDVDVALNQIGNVWETLVLNCLDIADATTLGKYATFGEGRWGALTRKPLVVFTGNTAASVGSATAVSATRKTDRVNAQLVAPGSSDLPLVVAARQLSRIAVIANNNPARDYGSTPATGLTPGSDSEQWMYPDKDQAVKAGSSTIKVEDGVVQLADTITFYHPDGDPTPAYRYVCDIIKVQQILFNLNLIFATPEWDGAPLIPDNQATFNRTAKKPKMAVAEVAALIDVLALNAIVSDPDSAKASIVAEIDSQNPKRLNLAFSVALSGNTNIISIDFNFGFYFGAPTIVN
jgi:phage tail sheath gpL-like